MFRNGDGDGPVSEINITPLVDVMLVLLIIFMVTAPMLENGIPIELPKASAKAIDKGETPVTLNLGVGPRIFLLRDEIQFSELPNAVKQAFKGRQNKEIFIRADAALPYGYVAQAMALVKQAGIHKIGLVTLPPEKSEGKPSDTKKR
jgi:biopolymer transport protein TolR